MRRRGFTLVELLVVVAIISLLLTTLLPGLQSARDHARSVFCVNNLRQFALASATYADTYNGYYPFAESIVRLDDKTINACWDFTTITDKATGEDRIEAGMLWQGGASPSEIHQCPAFDGKSNTEADPYTGYNYNYSYIGGTAKVRLVQSLPTKRVIRPSAQIDEVMYPSQTAIFGDGQWEGGANKYMRAWPGHLDGGVGGREAGTQGYRHQGKTNVAYCDGHAGSTDKCYTVSEPDVTAGIAPGTGFLSPDNTAYALMDVPRYQARRMTATGMNSEACASEDARHLTMVLHA